MKILVPTSGSVPAHENAVYVSRIAKSLGGADVIVLHVHRESAPSDEGKEAAEFLKQTVEKAGLKVQTRFREGEAVDEIIATAKEEGANLIVMGVSTGKLVREWVSANILDHSELSVVVIPHALKDI